MCRSRSAEILPLDPKLECTLFQLRRENRRKEEVSMENDNINLIPGTGRALRDYIVPIVSSYAIRRPTI